MVSKKTRTLFYNIYIIFYKNNMIKIAINRRIARIEGSGFDYHMSIVKHLINFQKSRNYTSQISFCTLSIFQWVVRF